MQQATQQQQEPKQASDEQSSSSVNPNITPSDDAWLAISVLRRLLLWPVTSSLLRDTGAGKVVSRLRKHTNTQVAELAEQVTAHWKSMVTLTAAPQGQNVRKVPKPSSTQPQAPIAASHEDKHVRSKAVALLAEALKEHVASVKAIGAGADAPASPSSIQALSVALEEAIHNHALISSGSRVWTSACRSVYRTRVRLLAPALRLVDGISPRLLGGDVKAEEVAGMESAALASDAVRRQMEEAARKRAEDSLKLDRALGSGGMDMEQEDGEDQVKCKSCGGKTSVATLMSGGTYAQERNVIQKYVCKVRMIFL